MENQDKQMKKEGGLVEAEIVSSKMSIRELAGQLEARSISPTTISKKNKMACVQYYITRGYGNDEIAEIMEVSIRTAQRYREHILEENSFSLTENFQARMAGDFYNNHSSHYRRLLRLSYSDNLSEAERAKVIYMLHQIDLHKVMVLDRLGYVNQAYGVAEMGRTIKELRLAEAKMDLLEIGKAIDDNYKSTENIQGPGEEYNEAVKKMKDREINLKYNYAVAHKHLRKIVREIKCDMEQKNQQPNTRQVEGCR